MNASVVLLMSLCVLPASEDVVTEPQAAITPAVDPTDVPQDQQITPVGWTSCATPTVTSGCGAAGCGAIGWGAGGCGCQQQGYGGQNYFGDGCRACRSGGSFGWGHCSSCGRKKKSCWDSTCDLLPHYPYLPEFHGYYYFRPYNYTHIGLHQQFVYAHGGDLRMPYSSRLFESVYRDSENTAYEQSANDTSESTRLTPVGKRLPDLEDLLRSSADAVQ